jgi:hypothetical protein
MPPVNQLRNSQQGTRILNIRNLLSLSLLLAATAGFAQNSAQSELKLDLLPNEAWWGGAVTLGTKMPYGIWKADDGTPVTGPVQKTFAVPLGRLLYFERQ